MESTASMPLSGQEEQNDEAMEPVKKPAAHFFKACRLYNGCIQNDKEEYHWEKGIQSVSPLTGAQVSTDAVTEVHPNKVPIRITSAHTPPAPTNRWERKFLEKDRSEPPLTFGPGVSHVMVDPDNDLFCFSSFRNDWNRDENYSGGNAFRQISPVAGVRRVGLGLPPLTRKGNIVECKDCGETRDEVHDCLRWRANPPHYCDYCVSEWVTFFRNLEQVFLIVPGLTRAEPGDDVRVYRFGYDELVEDILSGTDADDRYNHFPVVCEEDLVDGEFRGHHFVGVETIEDVGSDGPSCFEGNGIKLHEACAWEPDDESIYRCSHLLFLDVLFRRFCESRQVVGESGGWDFDHWWDLDDFKGRTLPETTRIAGGVIEFRVLTYELQEGDE